MLAMPGVSSPGAPTNNQLLLAAMAVPKRFGMVTPTSGTGGKMRSVCAAIGAGARNNPDKTSREVAEEFNLTEFS